MIMATLVNTPCIVMDNRTGKVSGVYDLWLKKRTNIMYIDSKEQLLTHLDKLNENNLDSIHYNNEEYRKKFMIIKEILG